MPIDPSTAFVSYSREDLEFVLRLAKDLKAKGAKVWMDKIAILPGQPWDDKVGFAVEHCERMLVVLSPTSAASAKVKNEFMDALDLGKVVIPILFRECKIPQQLKRLQYADFREDYDAGLAELLASFIALEEAAKSAIPNQARLEAVREQSVAVEQARLEKERPQAEAEKARQEQLGREQKAAEDKAKQENLVYRRIAAKHARSEEECKQAAETGDAFCMTDLGNAYEFGKGGVAADPEQAAVWYRQAADRGDPEAMTRLGELYRYGKGVNKDYRQALDWFRKAADAGDGSAMNELGEMYLDGQGVFRDCGQAVTWFQKAIAAKQRTFSLGDYADYNLGLCYEYGYGVGKDLNQAIYWYRKAVAIFTPEIAGFAAPQAKAALERLGVSFK